jgi:hypothetical protein
MWAVDNRGIKAEPTTEPQSAVWTERLIAIPVPRVAKVWRLRTKVNAGTGLDVSLATSVPKAKAATGRPALVGPGARSAAGARHLIGAVPYALEATHAASADTAAEVAGFVPSDYARLDELSEVARSGEFEDLEAIPLGLSDGDHDTLAALACAHSELAVFDEEAHSWACADVSEPAVLGMPTGIAVSNGGCALIEGRPICWPFTDIFPPGTAYDSDADDVAEGIGVCADEAAYGPPPTGDELRPTPTRRASGPEPRRSVQRRLCRGCG